MLLGNTELHFNFSRLSKGLGLGDERYDSGPPNTATRLFYKLVKDTIDYGCLLSRKIETCPKIYSVNSISVRRLNFVKYHAKLKVTVTCIAPTHQMRPPRVVNQISYGLS